VDAELKQAYVALGAGGLLKVGSAANPAKRLIALRQEFRRKGDELIRMEACVPSVGARVVEMHLIAHCRETLQPHSGWEWFIGGDFAAILALAHEQTEALKDFKFAPPPNFSPERLEELRLEKIRAQEAASDRARRKQNPNYEYASEWHSTRRRSERAIAQFVAFACGQQQPA
jgi:hypothetical protein